MYELDAFIKLSAPQTCYSSVASDLTDKECFCFIAKTHNPQQNKYTVYIRPSRAECSAKLANKGK